jgi:hypothetical protein
VQASKAYKQIVIIGEQLAASRHMLSLCVSAMLDAAAVELLRFAGMESQGTGFAAVSHPGPPMAS